MCNSPISKKYMMKNCVRMSSDQKYDGLFTQLPSASVHRPDQMTRILEGVLRGKVVVPDCGGLTRPDSKGDPPCLAAGPRGHGGGVGGVVWHWGGGGYYYPQKARWTLATEPTDDFQKVNGKLKSIFRKLVT